MSLTILETFPALIASYLMKIKQLCFMRVVKQKSRWLTDVRSHGANVVAKCYVTFTFSHHKRQVQVVGLENGEGRSNILQ